MIVVLVCSWCPGKDFCCNLPQTIVGISLTSRLSLVLNLRSTETSTPDEPAESTFVGNLGEPIIYSTPPIQIRVTTESITYSDCVPNDRMELQKLRPEGKRMSLSV